MGRFAACRAVEETSCLRCEPHWRWTGLLDRIYRIHSIYKKDVDLGPSNLKILLILSFFLRM